MALTYQAGRRIQGTAADRAGSDAVSGGWVELARTTLGSNTEVVVSSLPDKRYYMVLQNGVGGGVTANNNKLRFNSDSGTNYARRSSIDGGADSTSNSNDAINTMVGSPHDIDEEFFNVTYVANLTAREKLVQSHYVHQLAAGAATAPGRGETFAKWANTSAAINSMRSVETYPSGSEWVVLGWDPADEHTSNFWEELASVELGVAGDDLSSGTISAKKYLWVQAWYKNDGASDINALVRFNGDTGTNYSSRYSANGGADVTRTSRTWIDIESGSQRAKFVNMFIINNQSNEKLVIFNQMDYGASGAGNAPNRWEGVGKWTNTSNQITEINFKQLDAGDYASGAFIKVWGSN